ncbi:Bzip transcription factor [Phytophthora megakarya]|uniref:Bzip transcription factor n=1 Tax=Phytophthora megakarya TaxID=4795 RepID=A0A225V3U4_9STRA|nr:Bzip transcription factor [Phytophthora megakarya]
MTGQFETLGFQFNRSGEGRAKLSDGLVSHVLPRSKASGWQSSRDIGHTSEGSNNGEATTAFLSLTETQRRGRPPKKKPYYDGLGTTASAAIDGRILAFHDAEELREKRLKSEIRREQCRANQTRYRNKQRKLQLRLETGVQDLREELRRLKHKRHSVLLAEKTDQSPWTIVTEVFHILEGSFRSPWNLENEEDMHNDIETRRNLAYLHKAFTSNVAIGELSGIDTVFEHWRRLSQNFGDARLQLDRVESVTPNVIKACGRLDVVATELTMRHMFPHLSDAKPQSKYDVHPTLREQLLGHHLVCNVSVDFLFDNENGRVERLEPQIDLMQAVLRVLGNLEEVAEVFCPE